MADERPAGAGGVDVRSDRVTAAAVAHVAARERVRGLTAARNRIECARVAPIPDEAIMEGDYRHARPAEPEGGWRSEPCWKMSYERSQYDDGRVIMQGGWAASGGDPDEWCDACQRRQALHAELQRAKKAIGGTYLALRFAVRLGGPDGLP